MDESIALCVIEPSVSQDKMKAFITLKEDKEKGEPLTVEAIVQSLYSKGVVFGMKVENIRGIVQNPVYDNPELMAEGTFPANGKNGEIKFLINLEHNALPVISEDGSVNYKEMNRIENITKGQPLAVLIPPLQGTGGKTVMGQELRALNGKPALLPKGRNVSIDSGGQTLISEIDGQVLYADGKISVFSTHEVKADVDNSTGNIRFIGNVSIRGNVLSGFEVEAGGNIEVNGVVEGAVLKAKGNIILKRGMQGAGKGTLIAGGNIIAKFIESAQVEAAGDIRSEAIMHCDVKCGRTLELGGRKGLLVGGVVRVGEKASLKMLGNIMSTATSLEVGVDPMLRERLKFLKNDIILVEDALVKANQAMTLLKKMESVTALTPEKRELLAKSTRSKFFYENKIVEYRKEIIEIEQKLKQSSKGRIQIEGSAYPGVKVAIGSGLLYIKEEVHHCSLYYDGADVRVGPL